MKLCGKSLNHASKDCFIGVFPKAIVTVQMPVTSFPICLQHIP